MRPVDETNRHLLASADAVDAQVTEVAAARYERRRPEKTPLYKIVSEHLEGWLENRAVAEHPVLAHVERELRSYLTCGVLCFGFGRARCTSCGQGEAVPLLPR